MGLGRDSRVQAPTPSGDGSLQSHAALLSAAVKWAQVAPLAPVALQGNCTFPLLWAQASLDVPNCPKVGIPEPRATCRRDPGQEPDTDSSHLGSTLGARKLQRTRT